VINPTPFPVFLIFLITALGIFTEIVKLHPVTFFLMDQNKKCKIVVFGAFGAGKSTLIKTLDPASSHVEAACAGGTTTVALDYGRVQVNGTHINIFGTPGQERFEFAREIIGRGMDGAILLVDATSPVDDFIHHLYDSLSASHIPFVIFLNKCDSIGAHPASIQREFSDANIMQVSALDRQQSLEALSALALTLSSHHNGH
jgi:small GTP-binding protein